jgi:hypothetical protein
VIESDAAMLLVELDTSATLRVSESVRERLEELVDTSETETDSPSLAATARVCARADASEIEIARESYTLTLTDGLDVSAMEIARASALESVDEETCDSPTEIDSVSVTETWTVTVAVSEIDTVIESVPLLLVLPAERLISKPVPGLDSTISKAMATY